MQFYASNGEASKAEGRPQGAPTDALAELLYASQGEGQNVLDGIDEILRIGKSL